MKKCILLVAVLMLSVTISYAQSWQWGKRGGSSEASLSAFDPDESVVNMATDKQGNIYVLSYVYQTGLNVDRNPVTGWGDEDLLISSFKCDGTYRWSKDLGSNTTDVPVALNTDTLGGVYIAGYIPAFDIGVHISTDTSWTNTTYSFNFITKFDTNGNYKWIRYPEPATIGFPAVNNTYVIDMDVDKAGNSYSLWVLTPGSYAGGAYTVSTQGYYILEYDNAGNFVSGMPLDVSYTGYYSLLLLKRDAEMQRFYITGTLQATGGTLSFGPTPVPSSQFVGAFDNTGTFLWVKQGTDGPFYGSAFSKPAIDAQHNLYLAGNASGGDTFGTYTMINAGPTGAAPVVCKLDTNGNIIWAENATVNANTTCNTIALNGNEVDIAGAYPGLVKWPGYADSLNIAFGPGGYRIFISRFDPATGAVTGLDSLGSPSAVYCFTTSMVADKSGNFYVGGSFEQTIYMPGDTLANIGGATDFFVFKYGTPNCNCTIPVASYTSSGTRPVTFAYTGTTADIDSVVWHFGDGATSTVMNPTHTFAITDSYNVCVTVYSSCGTDSVCHEVHATAATGVTSVTESDLQLYPNPADAVLTISSPIPITGISITNLLGQIMYSHTLNAEKAAIDISGFPAGVYFIKVNGIEERKFIKQ